MHCNIVFLLFYLQIVMSVYESDLGPSYCRLVLIPEGAGARLSHQSGF